MDRFTRKLLRLCTAFALGCAALNATASDDIKLYAMDCGHIHFKDFAWFSDTGEYDGKSADLVDPCFLIVHPKGRLLWDTGLGDAMAQQAGGVDNGGIHLSVPITLESQLQQLNLKPDDIDWIAFSHFHFDHTGNAALFGKSRWIMNKAELAAMRQPEPPFGVDPQRLASFDPNRAKMIDGDDDVFGDGTVKILKAYGHTPGHQVLMLKLPKSGTVILSGDLYHTRDNHKFHRVPGINTSRAETLASEERIDTIIKNQHARFVIQHSPEDFAALPKFPKALE